MKFFKDKVPQYDMGYVIDLTGYPDLQKLPVLSSEPEKPMNLDEFIEYLKKEELKEKEIKDACS